MYVVTGATGHTGGVVAETLLAKGEKVRVIGRDAKRLERFTKNGAEAFVSDVTDADSMARAFSGAKAAYLMIPPDPSAPDVLAFGDRVSDALAAGASRSGLEYAVVLSSYGAEKTEGTGPVLSVHNLEKKLDRISSLNALYLRAGYFMENLLPQAGVIKSMGFMTGPVKAEVALPMIATRDIGAEAAEALLRLGFEGKQRRELQGARDVSCVEAAKAIGAAIGKPDLVYRQAPEAMLRPALVQMGMSASMVDLLLQMAEALHTNYMRMSEPGSAENSTPTTIEQFVADVFAPAYRGNAASA